ncbi:heat-inducible transcriptional repressor HrcA [Corynebacterium sp. TAE3-ERU12]|uniref:heat-inducible transcriptional repressor HrcA n=1 Tax=Corynebacterium sp. TAE3-ERU12 TaxID=2849491 RepID=UPI001C463B71|nr:heat-inducible transcriptional repressor HrcA [Corynebacterium sp. TAE3-ERU12]MBV7295768.1 heat-inducible transcriptional repressor HrcA [Corynebacterium sp. TAE3-ERU12]
MSSTTERRRKEVLRAIVADYVASQEPVGSKALVERHKLGVSSATIRNDMAVLEAEGYIAQQHASSGRIPTEKGYRDFVDGISDIKPLSRAERQAILEFLEGGVDLEDVLRRSVELLSRLTRQVAVVQLPTLQVSRVRHVELVPLADVRLLLVLITDTGRVEQRHVELAAPIDAEDDVPRLRAMLNRVLAGKTLTDASVSAADLAGNAPPDLRDPVLRCATVLVETLIERPSDRLILAGASNLSRVDAEFPGGLPSVLEALEKQVVVLKLLGAARDLHRVQVSIGEENQDESLRGTSVVSTGYGTGDAILGGLGVVGPTSMDYRGTMTSVAAVARYVGMVLGE